jgi:hypothetical protein
MSRDAISTLDWNAIEDAVNIVVAGRAKRIDGEGWRVYIVIGPVVRIDVPINHQGE